ncbi:glycogen synthase GlgA [Sideroxydans lithotrophicus]|uniref:Glycogen synthase n=1 Tax=Sideroxydans lithotrophicus (strain ES-1) TaxID=580332 RepID=D5CSV2_SIDLE|nr:glycogen synthase GlgA [Sideroxydans lithotrophicus]ADE12038.1 glycogen/starch synthase, ADP-glucose type [Sideroxydans lithotrophicus ES-1]
MKILFVTSEVHPLIKTGGLADVSGALPAALQGLGQDVRLLVPGYTQVLEKLENKRTVATFAVFSGQPEVKLLSAKMPHTEVPVYVLDAPQYFCRVPGPYQYELGGDWPDNAMRFGMLSRVAALLGSDASPVGWRADIVHCNDWQTGLAPAYLQLMPTTHARTVMTIHNMAFQGNFDRDWLAPLELPQSCFDMHGVEFHGYLSFLKAGLHYADRIVTVSPTYAHEIQTTEMGYGMQGLLKVRNGDVSGILNGIDEQEWNPATDPYLAARYDSSDLAPKATVKRELQQRVGLENNERAPLLGVVSRLTYQKGLDLLLESLPKLLDGGAQLVVLGSGESELERRYQHLAQRYPGRVSVTVRFDEGLSHQVMAGADIFLMPSRFEPCGLNQMYGMRYGTPPVVRRTGGLADSVIDAQAADGTGFVFEEADASVLYRTVERAIECYRDGKDFRRIQLNGMRRDVGWAGSAQRYLELYRKIA